MNQSKNKKKLGLWMSTSLVIGNMIGAGVFLMPAALAAYGGISIIGWLASSMGTLVLALVFSKLSKLFLNKSGGPYAYTRAGFGDFAGFLVAWGYWISIWVGMAVMAIAFVSALTVLFPMLEENSIGFGLDRPRRYLVANLGKLQRGQGIRKNTSCNNLT